MKIVEKEMLQRTERQVSALDELIMSRHAVKKLLDKIKSEVNESILLAHYRGANDIQNRLEKILGLIKENENEN